MILPLAVDYPYERRPWATMAAIGLNVQVFAATLGMADSTLSPWMLWPNEFTPWQRWTSGFLHGGLLHLAGNMLFLWVYGRYVEERIGPARFVVLYFLFAPIESAVFVLANFRLEVPAVGASGAISALMGVVMAAAPRCRVKTLVGWGLIARVLPIQAGLILGFWLVEQLVMVWVGVDGIAFSSHLGGFAAGVCAGLLMRYKTAGAWSMPDSDQSREDLELKTKALYYRELAEYHRNGREAQDRPGSGHIPEWLKTKVRPADPYEEELLKRWNKR